MNRNKLYQYDDTVVACLGDPHLGKKFKTGVPVNRLGEREKMVLQDLEDSLMAKGIIDIHVCMGDLFDKPMVDYQTIFSAYDVYARAAEHYANREYFIIMGNHDMSRISERYSSFQIFAAMIGYIKNIHVVMEPCRHGEFGFIPYHPFRTSEEMITEFAEKLAGREISAIFGHWDLDSFGSEMPHNILPINAIAQKLPSCLDIYTGHVHTAGERDYLDERHLEVIGSMQPYSHAEDPSGEFYITMTLDELYKYDTRLLKNKCVRVLLNEGEVLPEIDCLQLTGKKIGMPDEDDDIDVEMVAFDMQALMRDELRDAGVSDQQTIGFIFSEYDRRKAEEN